MQLRRVLAVLISCAPVVAFPALAQEATPDCSHDRERLLALDEQAFDQDLSNGGGGWRALDNRPGCTQVAADLIRDYRQRHDNHASILYWHEAQLRASLNDYPAAIALMRRSHKPAEANSGGWNEYVDASIAFLEKDRPALLDARERLSQLKPPGEVQLDEQGRFEITLDDGQKFKMRWPPNIDVVDGLIHCFDRSYDEAYGSACRPAQ